MADLWNGGHDLAANDVLEYVDYHFYGTILASRIFPENVAGDVSYNDSTTQGIVVLTVGVPAGLNTFSEVTATEKFPITGTVSAGIAPTTASVKLGATLASFSGYCVGASSNTVVWQVNGVAGGSMSAGTIAANATGGATYTAPATMPMTGSTVTVAAVCQVDTTKNASSTVTLTP